MLLNHLSNVNMAFVEARPNIRIEIQNNLMEPMDIDGENKAASDFEDGEISDKNETAEENPFTTKVATNNRMWGNADGGFATGVDIFDKQEQEKLQERANRFGLKPEEINNFTDEHLQQLHSSLGITIENEKGIRFQAVHMRGTDDMSTVDVFEYFGKYGPASVEWINDESCNVVWQDNISAARALHFISRAIKGMPIEGPCDPFAKDTIETDIEKNESTTAGRSILLINKNREVQLEKEESDLTHDNALQKENFVNISDISIPIPPGYWRLGDFHSKAKCILLRFAYKTDKKPFKAERFSEYYKKYGNPNFGGLKGLISESRKRKFKGIFDRNKELPKKGDCKNPWGDLAENWDADEKYSEKVFEPTIPKLNTNAITNSNNAEKADVLKRLGYKRILDLDNGSTDNQEIKVKSKVPRMSMYADEEEAKIKRKKQLLDIKSKQDKTEENMKSQDLRNIIGTSKKPVMVIEHFSDSEDLGTKLQNRTKKELHRNLSNMKVIRDDEYHTKHEKKTVNSKHQSPEAYRKRTKHRRELSSHKKKEGYDRNGSRMYSDRHKYRKNSSSNEEVDFRRTKSKVAVVIKTQKRPTVASTIWSRITPKKERLKTASERLESRKYASSSSESSSASDSSSSSSNDSSSDSSSDSEDDMNDKLTPKLSSKSIVDRPGFKNPTNNTITVNKKSPLRIEISNDHFKE